MKNEERIYSPKEWYDFVCDKTGVILKIKYTELDFLNMLNYARYYHDAQKEIENEK